MNAHWKTQYHQCRICHFNYDYITHLEQSEPESKYIFRQLKIQNKTHIPERYSWSPTVKEELWWQTIPRQTTVDIYRHYFADFGEIKYHVQLLKSFSATWLLTERCDAFYRLSKSLVHFSKYFTEG